MKAIEDGFVLETTNKKKRKTESNKWDKCLTDYKNYFEEYKKHYKNSQNGDKFSLSQYPYMRARWEVLKERIIKAHSNNSLTKKQIQKVVNINMKIVKIYF
ncbi:hypothetical protein [Flavobacterium frigoris]|uniref:Uncharacterized protein n=1 Tax=Flavobacterium frigoris (strain PS1) TaxID=1086011 RepID=H7FPK1_FLAFP|nr:hypothetical protein [Flavobacterium frigoris]EIA09681.1 hypothetical protein HJ01_01099 [Flavobacterium frigoris PS1]